MRISTLLLVSISVAALATACIPATPPTTPAGGGTAAPAVDDATLAADAAAAADGTDLTGSAAGAAMGVHFTIEVDAGYCYDVGVSAHDGAASVSIEGSEAMTYPAFFGNTSSTRTVTLTVCADKNAALFLRLVSYLPLRPGENQLFQQARFAVAAKRRSETAEERVARHARERDAYRAQRTRACDQLTPAEAYSCMQALEAELTERDALAAAAASAS